MYIRKKIDKSELRKKSERLNIPIIKLLLQRLKDCSEKEKINYTLLAVCPNSKNVLKASLRSAKRMNTPMIFAATLNQVDSDGGYTGWTHKDLIRVIKEESYNIGYDGPIITCIDHGGPWLKDIQVIEKWDYKRSMLWIKKSFEEALLAGFDLIHIDPTIDIYQNVINIETVADRTLELILFIEEFRKSKRIKAIAYEVGTEEVHGGLANIGIFKEFLKILKIGLSKYNLDYAWPYFIVGKVGTDLHTTTFDPIVAKKLVDISKIYGSYIKGHYTDFVSNPKEYPIIGIGAANIGPELTMVEYDALMELCKIEEELYEKNNIACKSNFKFVLEQSVLNSGRWKKWLREGETDFNQLDSERKELIIKTSARYIWELPEVTCSEKYLFRNLELNGIDAENWVLTNIEANIEKYFMAFNLVNLNKKLGQS